MTSRAGRITVDGTPRVVDLLRRVPVDPAATAEAANLLRRLHAARGAYTLTAQQQGDTGADIDAVVSAHNGGHYPAIRGYDYTVGNLTAGNATVTLAQIVADWDADRVIPTVSQHWTPAVAYETNAGDTNRSLPVTIADCFTPATTTYTRYQAWKQNLAADLNTLGAAGVPVLLRPFHEAGGTWFWWSRGTTADYEQLWRDLYTTLTGTYGVHNVLWVWCAGLVGIDPEWYPGDDVVDVIGHDRYDVTSGDYAGLNTDLLRYGNANKVRAVTELGWIPASPSAFTALPMSWCMTWHGTFLTQNSDVSLTAFYEHPQVITRATVRDFLEGTL